MHEVYSNHGGGAGNATGPGSQSTIVPALNALIREVSRLESVVQRRSQLPDEGREYGQSPASARDIDNIRRRRAERDAIFGREIFSDPAWDILLALYSAHLSQCRETIGSVTIASGVSPTTALRWFGKLEEIGLVYLNADHLDGRRRFAELSEAGLKAMNEYFCRLDQPRLAA